MDGIRLSHHHMTHVTAAEIQWDALVDCVSTWPHATGAALIVYFGPYESLTRVLPDME